MLLRFLTWWLCSWLVITGGVYLFMRIATGFFLPATLPFIAILAALAAVMVACVGCDNVKGGGGY